MKKAKRTFMEFSPDREGTLGVMDEFSRQMNVLAEGLAAGRTPRPQPSEKSRSHNDRVRRSR